MYAKQFETVNVAGKWMNINPIQADQKIVERAGRFRLEYRRDKMAALENLLHDIEIDGRHGIKYCVREKGKAFTATEVYTQKLACCLDETFLFLSICNQAGLNTDYSASIGCLVYRVPAQRDFHACGGIILESTEVPGKLRHRRFEADGEFEKMILNLSGIQPDREWSLILIDFTQHVFGAQHSVMVPMTDESLIAAYLTNTGTIMSNDLQKDGVGFLKQAARMGEPLAVNNLLVAEGMVGLDMSIGDYPPASFYKILTPASLIAILPDLRKSGDYKSLKLASLRLLQISCDNPMGYFHLGLAYLSEGRQEDAKRVFMKAYRVQTDFLLNIKLSKDPTASIEEKKVVEKIRSMEKGGNSKLADIDPQLGTDFYNREIMFSTILNYSLLSDEEFVERFEDYVRDNRDLKALGHGKILEKLFEAQTMFHEAPVPIQLPIHMFDACIRAKQLDKAQEILDTISNSLSPALKSMYESRIKLCRCPSASDQAFLTIAFLSSLSHYPTLEETTKNVYGGGYRDVSFDSEANILTFRVDDYNFFICKTTMPLGGLFTPPPDFKGIGQRVNMDEQTANELFWKGMATLFNMESHEDNIFAFASENPKFKELAILAKDALSEILALKFEEMTTSDKAKRALDSLSYAISIDPKNPELYHCRSLVHSLRRNNELAEKDRQIVFSLDPDRLVLQFDIGNS